MSGVTELIVDIGSATLADESDVILARLDLDPHHPTTHGLIRLRLGISDDDIVAASTEIGFMHRGVEKLLESRDYRQGLALTNRHDWLGAFSGELGYALALETMLGLDVPPRAQWLRTLVAELTRIISHLYFLDYFPDPQRTASNVVVGNHRERAQTLVEMLTGGRVHPMYVQVGGLRQDTPPNWLGQVEAFVANLRADIGSVAPYLDSAAFIDQFTGIGVIPNDLAVAHGASGAVGRASGIDVDLRRDAPYGAYGELTDELRVITASAGDVVARLGIVREQVCVALDIITTCATKLADIDGPINVPLPKTLRVPEGIHYGWSETPLGIGGYLVVSQGERTPWRVKLRTPSFAHVNLLGEILVGEKIGNLGPILSSLFIVTGDSDR